MTDPICPPDPTPAPNATPAPTPAPPTPAQKLRQLAVLLRAAEYLYDHRAFSEPQQEVFFKAIDEIIPRPTPTTAEGEAS